MKVAVFYDQQFGEYPTWLKKWFIVSIEIVPLSLLETWDADNLKRHDLVVILGGTGQQATKLSYSNVAALWDYVEAGGKLYGECISCMDFATSSLVGFKQEYPAVIRTSEKLRLEETVIENHKGSLLEWSGHYQKGFHFNSQVWMTIGDFRETHCALHPSEEQVPALVYRQLGQGATTYSSFPLLGKNNITAYRPHWLWKEVFKAIRSKFCMPVDVWEPCIRMSHRPPHESVEATLKWFLHSGILPVEDGSKGVYENVHSITGDISREHRPDCHAHTALMFYLYGKYKRDLKWTSHAHRLLDYLFREGYQDMNPQSPSYGFWKWFRYPGRYPDNIYTDDNAWVCFVLLYLYRATGIHTYRERGMLTAKALLETQQNNGLRAAQLQGKLLHQYGREQAQQEPVSMNPHFESIAHAAFLQAYLVNGDESYLNTAYQGTMYLLDNQKSMKFKYSRTSGYARLSLALSALVRYFPEPKLYESLKDIVKYLIQHKHSLGAIEEADNPDADRYGKEDTGVFIHNREGIADLLYTNNFLLMNMWEAWKATGDEEFNELYRDIRDFLSKVQIQSEIPRFNGGWMRAYDLNNEEYFGNNGDTGWGPYCMESGWTNAITTVGLLLGILDHSLFEVAK